MGIWKYEPHFLPKDWIWAHSTGQLFEGTDFGELWKLRAWISWCSNDNFWILNASSNILVVNMSRRFYQLDGSDRVQAESNWTTHQAVPHQMPDPFLTASHLFAIQSAGIFQLRVHPWGAVSAPKFVSPVPQETSRRCTASARVLVCGAGQYEYVWYRVHWVWYEPYHCFSQSRFE